MRTLRGVHAAFWGAAITVALWMTLAGCHRADADLQRSPQMAFRVLPELLGVAIVDSTLGIAFRPPGFMHPAPDGFIDKATGEVSRRQGAEDAHALAPVAAFVDTTRLAFCIVSRFLRPPDRQAMDRWLEAYADFVRKSAGSSVGEDRFRVGGADVRQFQIQNPEAIDLRLVCSGPSASPIQVDYIVPRSRYEEAAAAIESSIGSMAFF